MTWRGKTQPRLAPVRFHSGQKSSSPASDSLKIAVSIPNHPHKEQNQKLLICQTWLEKRSQLTPGMCRPAPGQTIKTNSPTQDDTHNKEPLLGSATMPLLAGPADGKHPLNTCPTITQKRKRSNGPKCFSKKRRQKHHRNGRTLREGTGTVPPPTTKPTPTPKQLHRPSPAVQPERHGAFCFDALTYFLGKEKMVK